MIAWLLWVAPIPQRQGLSTKQLHLDRCDVSGPGRLRQGHVCAPQGRSMEESSLPGSMRWHSRRRGLTLSERKETLTTSDFSLYPTQQITQPRADLVRVQADPATPKMSCATPCTLDLNFLPYLTNAQARADLIRAQGDYPRGILSHTIVRLLPPPPPPGGS